MKFSKAFIENYLLAARSPEEMVAYYTEKIIANGDRFSNISTDIGATVDRMVSTFNSTDKSKTFDFKKLRYDFLEKPIGDVVTRIVDYLQKNNLLKYLEFILFKATDKRLPEDLENIIENLKVFDELRKSPIQNFQKDIQRYNSFTELQQALEPYKDEVNKQKLLMNQEYVDKHQKSEGATTVLEEGPYKVIKITKADASADLCRNTGWCVKDPKYFEHYNIDASNPLYLISKNGYKYALIHFGTNQFKDANDTPASEEMGAELYPIIIKLNPNVLPDADFRVLSTIPEYINKLHGMVLKEIGDFSTVSGLKDKFRFDMQRAPNRIEFIDARRELDKIYSHENSIKNLMFLSIRNIGESQEVENKILEFIDSIKNQPSLTDAGELVASYYSSVLGYYDKFALKATQNPDFKKFEIENMKRLDEALEKKRMEIQKVSV